MAEPTRARFRARVVLCPACEQALVVVDGQVTVPVTIWGDPGDPTLTPHRPGCELTGKATPDGEADDE